MLRTIIVVWICIAVFGNHGNESHGLSDSSPGYGIEMGGGGNGPGPPADGHDPAALLPVTTGLSVVPNGVKQFRVEVASAGSSSTVTVTGSTKLGKFETTVAGSWSGVVAPTAGYAAPIVSADRQSSNGPVGPTVSGIVTASVAASTSTVQCRVYADDALVLMATGPGTVTCRVPAVDNAVG